MAEPKVQLVAPIGNLTVPGMNVTGVVTASYSNVGVASSIIQGNNIDIGAGIITATSFVGDQIGTYRAASLTGNPDLVVGVVTSSGLIGNITGDITGNLTGNVTGTAGSIISGNNLWVGIATGTLVGPGGNLTGIAATTFNTQTVAATDAATTIDLSAGNMITFNQSASTTVSLANTSDAMDVTLIRKQPTSVTTGAVTFDGTDDTLTLAASSDFTLDGDFTVEGWFYSTYSADYDTLWGLGRYSGATPNDGVTFYFGSNLLLTFYSHGANLIVGPAMPQNQWTHIAIVRSGSTVTMYVNGTNEGTGTESDDFGSGSNNTFNIGTGLNSSSANVDFFNGKISNFRVVKGTAVYTSNFNPPFYQLTNITNTKLLCCQDTSSATTAAVKPGTITAVSSPAAASATIENSSINLSAITLTWPSSLLWNGGAAPTLITANDATDTQQFQFLTRDSGLTWYGWEPFSYDAPYYKLFMWGEDETGQIGNLNRTNYSSPIQIGADGTWTKFFRGNRKSSSALTSDNTLWVWGNNNKGQLGQDDIVYRSSPTQVPGTTWKFGVVGNAAYVTKTDGTLWAWGYNAYGALGLNTPENSDLSSPAQIPGTTWSDVTSHVYNGGAFHSDNTIWLWGANVQGNLGQNNVTNYSSPVQVPGTTWVKIEMGTSAVLGTKTNGTLWSWGYNGYGNLGHNDANKRSSPTQIPGTTWSTGRGKFNTQSSSAAIKTDGSLWSWGRNDRGSLGQNNRTQYSSPMQVGTDTTWQYIFKGENNSMASKTDGSLWTWGQNDSGQLAHNNTTFLSSPTQIPGTWNLADIYHGSGNPMAAFQDL